LYLRAKKLFQEEYLSVPSQRAIYFFGLFGQGSQFISFRHLQSRAPAFFLLEVLSE
jgi:hypothetical protein